MLSSVKLEPFWVSKQTQRVYIGFGTYAQEVTSQNRKWHHKSYDYTIIPRHIALKVKNCTLPSLTPRNIFFNFLTTNANTNSISAKAQHSWWCVREIPRHKFIIWRKVFAYFFLLFFTQRFLIHFLRKFNTHLFLASRCEPSTMVVLKRLVSHSKDF